MRSRTKPSRQLGVWLATSLLLCLLFIGAETACAQEPVSLSETVLTFQCVLAHPQQRTFTFTVPEPVRNLKVVRNDLVEAETGVVILSSNISVDPTTVDQVSAQQSFQVTISGINRPGHYTGDLEITYDGRPAGDPLALRLDVIVEAVPSVDADVNSRDLTLHVRQPWSEFPFAGRPSADLSGQALDEVAVYLIQRGEGEAEVENAKVLTMRGAKGQTLPAEAVRVATELPFKLEGGEAKPLQIVAVGRNLRAGAYAGTLEVWVRNQPKPVQLPIKVKIKHGWLWPLIFLAGGLGLGAGLHWRKESGRPPRDLMRKIQELAKELRPGKSLQAGVRDAAMELLIEAADLANEGAPPADIEAKFREAETLVNDDKAAAASLLANTLQPLRNQVCRLGPGRTVRARLKAKLEEIEQRVKNGDYRELQDAQDELTDPQDGVRRQIEGLAEIAGTYSQVPNAQKARAARALDQADTPVDMLAILYNAGVQVGPPDPGLSFEPQPAPGPVASGADSFELRAERQLLLSFPELLAVALGYLFVLAVGWISLYVSSDVFGANALNYISLFLWGSVTEAVRGKTVTLTSLKTIATGAGQPGGP